MRDSKIWVVAKCDLVAGAIKLPPCVPRAMSVYLESDNPSAVKMKVQTLCQTATSGKTVTDDKDKVSREHAFYVVPEFQPSKLPSSLPSAVAGPTASCDPMDLWRRHQA